MSRTIDQAFRDEITAPQSGFALLTMLEIYSSELPATLRFVKNNVDVSHNGNVYTAVNFSVSMPSQEESAIQETTITISGVNRQVISAIRSISEPPVIHTFLVQESTPDDVELGPFIFKLRNVSFDKQSVTGSLLFEYTLRNNISRMMITSQNFPGLF